MLQSYPPLRSLESQVMLISLPTTYITQGKLRNRASGHVYMLHSSRILHCIWSVDLLPHFLFYMKWSISYGYRWQFGSRPLYPALPSWLYLTRNGSFSCPLLRPTLLDLVDANSLWATPARLCASYCNWGAAATRFTLAMSGNTTRIHYHAKPFRLRPSSDKFSQEPCKLSSTRKSVWIAKKCLLPRYSEGQTACDNCHK